jgi:hypothetical protein
LGVNSASKPLAAPGSVSEMPTIKTNITTKSGIKKVDARATPFCTPAARMKMVNSHTPISGHNTLPTKSKPKPGSFAIFRYSPKKKLSGCAPHVPVTE